MADAPPQDDLRTEAGRAIGWSFFEKWASRIATLVLFAVLGRLLPLEAFGLVALATVVTDFLALVSEQGISRAVVVANDPSRRLYSTAFWLSLLSGVLLTLALFFTAPFIASLLGEEELAPILQWLSLLFVLRGLSNVQEAILKRELKFRVVAMRRVISAIGGGVIGIAAAFAGAGVWSLVAEVLSTAAIGVVVLWAGSSFRPSFEFDRERGRELWGFGMNVLGIDALSFVSRNGDNLVVGTFLGARALGFYAIAYKILSLLSELVIGVVSSSALPLFARIKNDKDATVRALMTATKYSAAFATPVFAGLLVLAPFVVPLMFGEKWGPSVPVVRAFCFVGLLMCVTSFDRSVLLAAGRPRLELWITLGGAVLNIAAFLIAVRWGYVAVGIALAVRLYLYWPVRLWALKSVTGLSIKAYVAQWLVPVAASVVLVGVCAAAVRLLEGAPDAVIVVVASAAGGLAYLLALALLDRPFVREVLGLRRLLPGFLSHSNSKPGKSRGDEGAVA